MRIRNGYSVLILGLAWLVLITAAHHWLNRSPRRDGNSTTDATSFKIGFLPVTCHLTCPVTHFINEQLDQGTNFEPIRFNGWPELKEAFLAGHTQATFILAPMAIALREEGVPLKIVYLGHRDGTAMMAHRDSDIYRIEDLVGKRIAVPNRFSNQRLLLYRAFRERNLVLDDRLLIDMPPPDMAAALAVKAVDAITSGEPFMGQTELDGYGRIVYLTKDVWPNFISCVLAVHEDVILSKREQVQALVDGIAKSGKWIDQSMDHRMQASEFVARHYYNQNPRLLKHVLSKPPDRVKYTNLSLHRADFKEIEELGKLAGSLKGTVTFDDYADPSFVTDESDIEPHPFEYRQ